jgi:ankyrin repeat protein
MAVWESRRRPLHLAVIKEQAQVARVLLELGADIEATDIDDLTSLDLAGLRDSKEISEILLQHGAKVRLPAAFGLRKLDIADELIAPDPELLKPGHRWGELISIACTHSHDDVLEAIIARGASVHLRVNSRAFGTKNYTPLHEAAWYGNLDAIRVLLRHGAEPSARDDTYRATPMEWARHANRTEAVELFQSLETSL